MTQPLLCRNIVRFEQLPGNATIFGRNQSAEVLRPGLMRRVSLGFFITTTTNRTSRRFLSNIPSLLPLSSSSPRPPPTPLDFLLLDLTSAQDGPNGSSNSAPTPPVPNYPYSTPRAFVNVPTHRSSATDVQLYRLASFEPSTNARHSPPSNPTLTFATRQFRCFKAPRSSINTTTLKSFELLFVAARQIPTPQTQINVPSLSISTLSPFSSAAQRCVGLECTVYSRGVCALFTWVQGAGRLAPHPEVEGSVAWDCFRRSRHPTTAQRRVLLTLCIDVPRAGRELDTDLISFFSKGLSRRQAKCASPIPMRRVPSMFLASRERRAAARSLDYINQRPASGTYASLFSTGSSRRQTNPTLDDSPFGLGRNWIDVPRAGRMLVNVAAVAAAPRSGANLCLCTSPSAERRLSQDLTIQIVVRRLTMIDVRRETIVVGRANWFSRATQTSNTRRIDVPPPTITVWIVVPREGYIADVPQASTAQKGNVFVKYP
ncbi:hypothetical protein R3P38DRAFT_2792203 [Favolaschia claudopus]|uniref:Uncharacterized protein n=1 Tax=Favolaschia claudopus TaxID=2862362 RepID=A0AAW0AFS3_9AGAR